VDRLHGAKHIRRFACFLHRRAEEEKVAKATKGSDCFANANSGARWRYGSGGLAVVGGAEGVSWDSLSANLPALRPASPEKLLSG
jgi:hypothetical protein